MKKRVIREASGRVYYQYGLSEKERLADPNYKGRWLGDVDDYDLLMIWLNKKDKTISLEEAKNAMPIETEETVRRILSHYGTNIQTFNHEDLNKYGREHSPIQTTPGLAGYLGLSSPWDMKKLRTAPSFSERWALKTNPPAPSWVKQTWKYNYRPQD